MNEEPEGFPKVFLATKWVIVVSLTFLAIAATAFWTLVLGGFAGSGFRATDAARSDDVEFLPITAECAWPYGVNDSDAKAVCRMYHRSTPEQRAERLK